MADIYAPEQIAIEILEGAGFDFDELMNDKYGLIKGQLSIFSKFSPASNLRKNAYKTINRLKASPNKPNLNFKANVKNTLVGTIKAAMMESFNDLSDAEQGEIVIKWQPSSAEEPRSKHMLNYGKVMTMREALRRGLGQEYGCQCGFTVLSGSMLVKDTISKFKKDLKR